jgi:flagellar capping protein FliD
LNACRLDQLDKVRRDVRAKTLTEGQGRGTVRAIQNAIEVDRRTVNAVAGTNKSYQAYQSVLNQTNRTAATRTQTAVSNYKPKAQAVRRTSRGKPAFTVATRPSAPTEVAAAEISRTRLNAAAQASNEAAANAAKALIGDLDSELPI